MAVVDDVLPLGSGLDRSYVVTVRGRLKFRVGSMVYARQTFPTVLAESTPNDGNAQVTWPDVATTKARIKVEAVENYFFDVNDADITILSDNVPDDGGTTPTPTPTTTTSPTTTPTTTPTTPPTTTPTPTAPPTTTPTPTLPADKVASRISTKMVKPVEVNTRVKLRVTVRAKDVVPSGKVRIRAKGAGKSKSWTKTLGVRGRTSVLLPRYYRTGKVKVVVRYRGDDAVRANTKKIEFAVVDRRTIR